MTVIDLNFARRQDELEKHGVNADDIQDRILANTRAFIEWLYGGRAYFTKTDARIGNVFGESGSSLSISLRTGLWRDHSTDESGNIIGLYRAWRGYQTRGEDFVLSLQEIAKDYLGDPVDIVRPAWSDTPRERIEKDKLKLGDKPRQENVELGAEVAEYRYFDLHGKIVAAVKRYEPDGTPASKTFRPWCFKTVNGQQKWVMGAPDIRPLYNLPEVAISPTVVLVEGEKCAEALRSIGIVATTAMQGAKAPIDKTDWEILRGKTITIWPDNDAPGYAYAKAVAAKLQSLGCTVLGITPPKGVAEKWDAADCVAEGGNAHDIIASATPVVDIAPLGAIKSLDTDDMEDSQPPEFLVEGLLTVNGLSMLWGASGSLKSFVGIDIGMCIATGMAWHGKAVKQGSVWYIGAEGAHGLKKRIVGWRRSRGRALGKPAFRLVPQPVAISDAIELQALVEHIMAVDATPVLVILDTVAMTFTGDENKQVDMTIYVQACRRLMQTGAHVMLIHHSGVATNDRERGSSVLRAAMDTIIKVHRKKDLLMKIDLLNRAPQGKQKDFEEAATIHLEGRQVAFEMKGVETQTLILNERDMTKEAADDEAEEVASASKKGGSGMPRGSNQRAVLAALKSAQKGLLRSEIRAMTGIDIKVIGNVMDSLVKGGWVECRPEILTGDHVYWLPGM